MSKNEIAVETETETPPIPAPLPIKATRVQAVTAASLVSDLAGAMPTPTDKAGKTEKETEGETTSVQTDANGTPFDANRHAVKPDGTPRIDKKGRYYSNKLGREKATTATAPTSNRPAPSFTDPLTGASITSTDEPFASGGNSGPVVDQFSAMAEMYLAMLYAPAIAIFSVEAKPDADQHEALKGQLTISLRHSGAK